ncbi:MAG: hypothetical protein JW808_04390 [Victivallales bacterium]|nr:hypothetical protein [Victivallales bacterium]
MTAKQRSMLIMPICLLLFNALQEVIEYFLPRVVPNPYTRTFVLIILFAAGFSLVADMFVPWLVEFFEKGHRHSRSKGGSTGVAAFYLLSFVVIYVVYFVIFTKGTRYILPPAWR